MVIGGVLLANREVPKAGLLVRHGKVYNRKHSTGMAIEFEEVEPVCAELKALLTDYCLP